MTTLHMYMKKEVFNYLEEAIETINQYELCITYDVSEPNKRGYVKVKVMAKGDYYIFRLGVEMGKNSTDITDYV